MKTHRLGTRWRLSATLLALALLATPPPARAEDNTLTVIDGVTVTTNGGNVTIGASGTNNALLITNGGALFNLGGIIGLASNASGNTAIITGTGSTWSNSGGLIVGHMGSGNSMVIANGARVYNTEGVIGRTVMLQFINGGPPVSWSRGNSVLVTGAGTVWSNSGALSVGYQGSSNLLVISNGAHVFSDRGYLAAAVTIDFNNSLIAESPSNNTAIITGANTLWSNRGELAVGYQGSSNTLLVSHGARVVNGASRIGGVTIDSYLGRLIEASNNLAMISGTGTVWDAGARLEVGFTGGLWDGTFGGQNNRLVITDGARVTNSNAAIGGIGSAVIVDGPGSRWDSAGVVETAVPFGTPLTVTNGGNVTAGELWIGLAQLGTTNRFRNQTVQVRGAGSSLLVADKLVVGLAGVSNKLILAEGARLVSGSASIGLGSIHPSFGPAANGNMVLVTDAGTIWTNTGLLQVGERGSTNSLVITNGGKVVTGSAAIGVANPLPIFPQIFASSVSNAVRVTGLGSRLEVGDWLAVGVSNNASQLLVADGAIATNRTMFGDGAITLSGAGSRIDTADTFWAGYRLGGARILVTNGAVLQTGEAIVGNVITNSVGNIAELTLNRISIGGGDATWINYGTIVMGNTNVAHGSQVSVNSNAITLTTGGRLFTSALLLNGRVTNPAPRQFVFVNGGELNVTNAGGTGLLRLGSRSTLEVKSGTAKVDELQGLQGTSVVLVSNILHVGGQTAMNSGDLLAGRFSNVGSTLAGGLVAGSATGSAGLVHLGRPPLVNPLVTNRIVNAAGNALTVIGDAGDGLLTVSNVALLVNELVVGRATTGKGRVVLSGLEAALRATAGIFVGSNGVTAGVGSIIVSNGATLSAETLLVGSNGTGGVTNFGGRFQFGTSAPVIQGPGIVGHDVIIDFTNVANAFLQRDHLPGVTNIQLSGAITYELSRSTNATPEFLELRTNSAAHYQRVSLRGNSLLQTTGLLIGPGTALASPTNGKGSVSGLVTNRGRFTGHTSALTFLDAVEFSPGATVDGTNVTFAFPGGLLMRSNELTIGQGVTLELQHLTLDGSTLVTAGTLQFTNLSMTLPTGGIILTNGTVAFRNLTNAPTSLAGDLAGIARGGSLDLRLNNATNALVAHYTFAASNEPTAYGSLRLDGGETGWRSGSLTIGTGGLLWISNTSPTISIGDATLRIDGGRVINAVGRSENVGFADVTGARTMVNGPNAFWQQAGPLYVGWTNGLQFLLVTNGATASLGSLIVGGTSNSQGNRVAVTGMGSSLAVQSLSLGADSPSNEFLVAAGANVGVGTSPFLTVGSSNGSGNTLRVLAGGRLTTTAPFAAIGEFGRSNSAHVMGAGSVWNHSGDLRLGGGYKSLDSSLTIEDGGVLITGQSFMGYDGTNAFALVSGVGSLWSNRTDLHIGFLCNSNLLRVENGGAVWTSNAIIRQDLNTTSATVRVDGGYFIVSNGQGTAGISLSAFVPSESPMIDLRRGVIHADGLGANTSLARIDFGGGILSVRDVDYFYPSGLVVGDATNGARLHVRGGAHTFTGGLSLNEHAALTGTGTVVASVTNRGDIAPGESAGALILQSNLTLAASARMCFEIGGLLVGSQHDFVAVSNLVEFAGTLSLALLNGFTPAPGDAFTLMSFAGSSGAFANAAHGARVNTADNLGSFHVSYSGTALTVSAYQSNDTDADGIEDAWALTYFGASPLANGTGPTEKFGDLDGDGQSNHAEFVAGTNPADALDVFGVTELLPRADGAVRVRFRHLPGKTQRLFVSTDLVNWIEVVGPWLSFPVADTAEWLDDGAQVGAAPSNATVAQRYYRVTVE